MFCRFTLILVLLGPVVAQGPGSCGVHLDVLANHTSTHAAIGHLPGAPGSGPTALAPGAAGNPYTAYASPGSSITLRMSAPGGALGPTPFGAGSTVTIAWAIGAPNLAATPTPLLAAPCQTGQSLTVSVLPLGGVLVDGGGFFSPPPVVSPTDPGWPLTWSMPLTYPILPLGTGAVTLQALLTTPSGVIVLSNAVSVLPGPSPWETSLKPALTTPCGSGGLSHLSSGQTAVATPPGFMFYGVPAPFANLHVDGFLDFLAPGSPCDPTGEIEDFGCYAPSPEARPRIDVNHFDGSVAPHPGLPVGVVSDVTREFVLASATTPARVILRWKHVIDSFNFSYPPANLGAQRASFVCELWGDGRIVICRQFVNQYITSTTYGQMGIGPGLPGQGFTATPPTCVSVAIPSHYGSPAFASPFAGLVQAPGLPGAANALLGSLATVFEPAGPGLYALRAW